MRYKLFFGDEYYPKGGWRDYQADYPSLDAAKLRAVKLAEEHDVSDGHSDIWLYRWAHIYDTETHLIVWRSDA